MTANSSGSGISFESYNPNESDVPQEVWEATSSGHSDPSLSKRTRWVPDGPKFVQIQAVPIAVLEDPSSNPDDTPPDDVRLFALDETGRVWEYEFLKIRKADRRRIYPSWRMLSKGRKIPQNFVKG